MNKSQHGVAPMEAVLILVLVAIIGGTGYYVWRSKDIANKNYNQAASLQQLAAQKNAQEQKTEQETTSTTVVGNLVIKEWSIQIKLTTDIANTNYKLVGNTAWLSTPTLDNNSQCQSESTSNMPSFQGIERLSPNDPSPEPGGGTTAQAYARSANNYVSLGKYYYFFASGNGFPCAAESVKMLNEFQQAFKTLSAT